MCDIQGDEFSITELCNLLKVGGLTVVTKKQHEQCIRFGSELC